MPDLLQSGSDWLADQLKTHVSREVVYQRGAQQVAVQATIGRTLLKLDDGYGGVRLEWTDRDFLIHTADLALAGTAVLPERGDQIRETAGTQTVIYEVMAPGKEPVWRWSDGYRKLLRIHTKQIGVE
ncbi:MAG: hypothetical protein KatS3mg082_2723 [Nitrospiraceae bacterium]|nr:MAG: hypothetical protein KatS3mg082_2723 [Nitrospiraceae bacterium]GIW81326.1 MAG: hypothetical protein KatS3mg105_3133 [Gemmatales bacterium]